MLHFSPQNPSTASKLIKGLPKHLLNNQQRAATNGSSKQQQASNNKQGRQGKQANRQQQTPNKVIPNVLT
eukprot:4844201-Amphidinium_carterae.1